MPRQLAWMLSGLCLFLAMASASAANLIIYDDQSENGFDQGCSFPSPSLDFDFANAAPNPVHTGTHSVRFTPDHYNLLSWCTPATYSATTNYTGIDFWVNGGATGSQNVNLVLGLAGNPVAQASLTALQGIPLGANLWTHFQLAFSNPGGLNYSGQFDQISFQEESNALQANMYFDDVTLIAPSAAASGQNYIFGDSFEPEYMFVPQFNNNSVRVYQRTTNTTDFAFMREASLGRPVGAGLPIRPNAVAFAADGGLWVVDSGGGDPGNSMLWRYTLQAMLSDPNPAPTAHVGPTGQGGLYDLAFFGDYAYVSSDSLILKYPTASMTSGSNPLPTTFNSGGTPVGLAFDPQGRFWICNYGAPGNLVRMSNTGTIDVTISGAVMDNAEGLSFDEYGTLWVGDNNEPTLYGFGSWQIGANGSPPPTGQINLPTPGGHAGFTGYAGGIRFDRHGDVRINYEYDYTVLGYTLGATPRAGGGYDTYTSSALTPLSNATTDPGRGGIAIWPVPSTVHR